VKDALIFKILKNYLITVIDRSVVRLATDASHRNKRVTFESDLQETIKPSYLWKDSHHKNKSRKTNSGESNITRSKEDFTDQHVDNRTRSMMYSVNVKLLSIVKKKEKNNNSKHKFFGGIE
jgi:hypothetical protein